MYTFFGDSNFGLIEPLNTELAALACLNVLLLLENYSKYVDGFTCWLSDERLLPFRLLVIRCHYSWCCDVWRPYKVALCIVHSAVYIFFGPLRSAEIF